MKGKNMEKTLTERRAEFVYDAARLAAIAAGAPFGPVPWADREEPFKKQFLEVFERLCGEQGKCLDCDGSGIAFANDPPTRCESCGGRGKGTTPEKLHRDWMQAYIEMGWVHGENYDREAKVHPDLVPYAQLGQLERDKDAVFVALCEIARRWVYEDEE